MNSSWVPNLKNGTNWVPTPDVFYQIHELDPGILYQVHELGPGMFVLEKLKLRKFNLLALPRRHLVEVGHKVSSKIVLLLNSDL